MFSSYEFTFDGKPSSMFGLMIYDIGGQGQEAVSFGNVANILEVRTLGRVQPIHFGVNYHETPLSFSLVFGAQEPLDRYDLQRVSYWLTGKQSYSWLTISQPDLEYVQFKCIVQTLTPIFNGWLPVAFRADIVCDCPYAYGLPFTINKTISSGNNATVLNIRNDGSAREFVKPEIIFAPESGTTSLRIINENDNNRVMSFTNFPANIGSSGYAISINNNNGIVTIKNNLGVIQNGYNNIYDYFNLNFFRFVPGDNNLSITGNGDITFSGRFLYNVGA